MMKAWGLALAATACAALAGAGCCPMCSRKKAPEKPAAQAQAPAVAGVVAPATTAQSTCAVMGGRVNKALYVDYGGKRIYACCPGCLPELRKDPAKYVKKLEDQGVALEQVH